LQGFTILWNWRFFRVMPREMRHKILFCHDRQNETISLSFFFSLLLSSPLYSNSHPHTATKTREKKEREREREREICLTWGLHVALFIWCSA
jgi:hypothetical protein